MFKVIVLVLVVMGSAFVWNGYNTHFNNPSEQQGGNLVVDNMPEDATRVASFFYVEETVKKKRSSANWIPLEDIPLIMQQAMIAVEDSGFYEHGTFDVTGIAKATFSNLQAGEIVEGGSTLTQQLAKSLFLKSEDGDLTKAQKAEEAVYGMLLEGKYSKEEILELYLNSVDFGAGAYGLQEASQKYFGKNAGQLTIAECVMLAGIPANPSIYSPLENAKEAKKRYKASLDLMVKNGFIGPQMAKTALEEFSY